MADIKESKSRIRETNHPTHHRTQAYILREASQPKSPHMAAIKEIQRWSRLQPLKKTTHSIAASSCHFSRSNWLLSVRVSQQRWTSLSSHFLSSQPNYISAAVFDRGHNTAPLLTTLSMIRKAINPSFHRLPMSILILFFFFCFKSQCR